MEHETIQKRVKGTARVIRILAQIIFWVTVVFGALTAIGFILMLFVPDSFSQGLPGPVENFVMLKYSAPSQLSGQQMLKVGKMSLLVITISSLMGAFFLWQLIGILREVETGRPFSRSNARRLGKMGILFLVSSVVYRIGVAAAMYTAVDIAGLDTVNVKFTPDVNMILIGILLLILAGIFRYGSYLQEEYDATL